MLTNRWAVLGLIFLARMSMAFQFQSIPPIASFLSRDLGLSYSQIGTLVGLFMLPGVGLALPGGLVAQRFGDKRVTIVALALLTLGASILGLASSFPLAFAARLVGGVGSILLNVEATKLTTDWFAHRETSTAMGIMLGAWPMGIAVALSTLGALAAAATWQTAMQATAAVSAVVGIAFAILYTDPPRDIAKEAPAPDTAPNRLWRITRGELARMLTIGAVWMLTNSGFVLVLSFGPAFLKARGFTVGTAGLVIGLGSWTTIASVPLGGWLNDRIGRHGTFIVAGALVSSATILGLASGSVPALWSVLFGLTSGLWPSAILTLAGKAVSPESRHTGFGVFYTVFYVGMALVPPLAGWLLDTTSSAAAALWLASGLMAMAVPALLAFRFLRTASDAAAPGIDSRALEDSGSI